QGRVRGGCVVPGGARVEPRLRRSPAGGAPLRPRRSREPRRAAPLARSAPPAGAAGGGPRAPLRRALGGRGPRCRGQRMTGTLLHLQTVAGSSGSEANLLSRLPRLRERGWDVRMLMLHENEPGAGDFAQALRARGVPLDAIPLRADFDPIAFVRLV